MFYYLNGSLMHVEPALAVLDVGGVGYQLTISGTTYNALPPRSTNNPPTVKLFTYLAVREDGIELFGFISRTELSTFKMLISVSGVGPKAAMSILSLLTPEQVAMAICTEDRKTIAKANGIGPKTAARIVLELKDKMLKESGGELPSGGEGLPIAASASDGKRGKLGEATDALIVLGYSRSEALAALKDLDTSNAELEEIIRLALKKLMRF